MLVDWWSEERKQLQDIFDSCEPEGEMSNRISSLLGLFDKCKAQRDAEIKEKETELNEVGVMVKMFLDSVRRHSGRQSIKWIASNKIGDILEQVKQQDIKDYEETGKKVPSLKKKMERG